MRRAAVLAAAAAAAALTLAISLPPALGSGLPSYRLGVFHSATIGYYLETAVLMNETGWWTSHWCCGFQDLVRFYPPLGNAILLAAVRATGSASAATGLAMAAALSVLALGASLAGRELGGSPLASLLLLAGLLSLNPWVSTIAVYWEYTRILGDGLALASLALLDRGLREGGRRDIVASALLASLTLLSSLISAVWLAAAAAAIAAYRLAETLRGPLPEASLYQLRLLALWLLVAAAASSWWLVPALAPWGLSHYLRVGAPPSEKLRTLLLGASLFPPTWAPAPQLALLAAAAAALAAARRLGPAGWAAVAVAAVAAVYGQGLRLVPPLSLLLLASAADALRSLMARGRRLHAVVLAAALAGLVGLYAAHYYPVYKGLLTRDYSYLASDEYRVAKYLEALAEAGHPVRVYAMYGPRLHGNQWLNVFAPHVDQALSGFMEGCLDPRPARLDYLVKNSLDYHAVYRLLLELHVNYLWVDREWMSSVEPNAVQLLVEHNLLEPLQGLNRLLHYSLVYRVAGAAPPQEPGGEPVFLTPARLLGLAVSVLAAMLAARLRCRL